MTRDEMIDFLIEEDYNYIMECANGPELLDSYLKFGFKGYFNFTDAELVAEVNERNAMKEMS
jgi:hypothetical protein